MDIQSNVSYTYNEDVIRDKEGALPICQISGNEEHIGKIISCNVSFCKLFGYSKEKLIGCNVNMLMPTIFSRNHNQFIINSAKEREGQEVGHMEHFIVGLHKSGYIFPAWLRISTCAELSDSSILIGSIETERKHVSGYVAYALLNTENYLINVSSNAIRFLRISNEILAKAKIFMPMLLPDLFKEGVIDINYFGEGLPVNYYFPDYEKMREETPAPLKSGELCDYQLVEILDDYKNIEKSTHFISYNCRAIQFVVKGIGKIGYLLCFENIEEMRSRYKNPDLKSEEPQLYSYFVYDFNTNKYIQNPVNLANGPLDSISINDPSETGNTLSKVYDDDRTLTANNKIPSKKVKKQGLESCNNNKNNFYQIILTNYRIDKATKEQYGNLKDILLRKCELDYGEGIVTYRIGPYSEIEKVLDEGTSNLLNERIESSESEDLQRRKILDDTAILAKVDIENKKSLENAIEKFLNVRLIVMAAISISLIVTTIIICDVLKFVFFDQQYNGFTQSLATANVQSKMLPDMLYAYSNVLDIALCNSYTA